MTSWVTLGSGELGADKILTAPTMQAVYDNPTAITEGATGAPRVQTAALQDLAVTTAKLNDAAVTTAKIGDGEVTPEKLQGGGLGQANLHSSSGTVSTSGTQNLSLPGGQYGFYPQLQGSAADVRLMQVGGWGSFTTSIYISSSGTTTAFQRYITASPPFDLGDGPLQGFIFVLMRGGKPVASYAADVPPWAYNGPTCIRPDVIDRDGRKWRRLPKARSLHMELCRGGLCIDAYRERLASPEYRGCDLALIDQAMKNADMALVPHPFSLDPGDVVVLLDPMDRLVPHLLEAQADGEDLPALLLSGKIGPDNDPLARKGPPGVIQARIRG